MHFWPNPWFAGNSTSTVTICPTVGRGKDASSARQANKIPLLLIFCVEIAFRTHKAGEVTWQRSFISIRGLSRLLMFFISVDSTWRL